MGDKLLDTTQVINGIAVLLSFFVGYRYALKKHDDASDTQGQSKKDDTVDEFDSSDSDNYKMVLLVRNDLKMGKGKIGAQCAHAAVGAYQRAVAQTPLLLRRWKDSGCAKIALRVESEREMMALKRAANVHNLNTCLICDAGLTQVEPNSKTVLAIGPAAAEEIDKVTGHLKLL